MKAKIKHTQQIIDVEWNIRGWIWDSPNGKRLFAAEELAFFDSDNIDWQSFRNQAAKDILCHLLDRYTGDSDNKGFVEQAIGIANELIKQLKEKEEK